MTPRSLALTALDHIGVATIADATSRQLERIADDLTATMQLIYAQAPQLYKQRRGALAAAPQSVSIDVTNGSQVAATTATFADGSSILIDGDPNMNEIRVNGTAKALMLPYSGTTGTKTATIYGDSILLDSQVDRVIGSVAVNESVILQKHNTRQEAAFRRDPELDYGRTRRSRIIPHAIGEPRAYWVEPYFITDGTASSQVSTHRIRLYPMPLEACTVAYDVRVRSPRYTVQDIYKEDTDATASLAVSSDCIESIIRPLFLLEWTSSPWFENETHRAAIEKRAAAATALLAQFRIQQPSNRRISATF